MACSEVAMLHGQKAWLIDAITTAIQAASDEQLNRCRAKHGPPVVRVQRLAGNATLPKRAYSGDAGFDLFAAERCNILPNGVAKISTQIAVEIPHGYFGYVATRSSMAAAGVFATGGVIDGSYRGPIHVVLNVGPNGYEVLSGDKIAQLLILPVFPGGVEEAEELTPTERGAQGFGSSGR